ncbi:MAG: hypothetical protein WBN51_11345, partial [Gammaproteobacteria bacterium]
MPLHPCRYLVPLLALLSAGCGGVTVPDSVGLLEWDRVELIAEISEPIIEIRVREGTRVGAGAVLLQLDNR